MAKYFGVPFATTGDKLTIPDAAQGNGSVSYAQGFGFDYERPDTDPLYKPVPREGMNGVLNDITAAIGEIQKNGVATWDTLARPYALGALVRHGTTVWRSLVTNNNATPAEGASWTAIGVAASETIPGVVRIATTAQAQSLIDDSVVLTPKTLGAVGATTTTRGITSFATAPEADAGIINNKAITPDIYARKANETTAGIARIATLDEMTDLNDGNKIVTPAKLKDAFQKHLLGIDQSYQNVLSQRNKNTTYTNTTARPIFVIVNCPDPFISQFIEVVVDGVVVFYQNMQNTNEVGEAWTGFIVPAGKTYRVNMNTASGDSNNPSVWTELR